jgi:hypothetical protein
MNNKITEQNWNEALRSTSKFSNHDSHEKDPIPTYICEECVNEVIQSLITSIKEEIKTDLETIMAAPSIKTTIKGRMTETLVDIEKYIQSLTEEDVTNSPVGGLSRNKHSTEEEGKEKI